MAHSYIYIKNIYYLINKIIDEGGIKMKKLWMMLLLSITLVACQQKTEIKEEPPQSPVHEEQTSDENKTLIVYFTFPETDGVDTSSSASRVVLDGEVIGATEYITQIIKEETQGELFQIETEQTYPGTHEPLVDQASREK